MICGREISTINVNSNRQANYIAASTPRPAADRNPDEAECGRMRDQGYLVVRGFFAPEQVAQILGWTQELQLAPEVSGRHWLYREQSVTDASLRVIQRIENFCPFHPGFDQLIRRDALARWVGALLGEPAVLFKEKINFKMPGGGAFKAHQDQQAGWSRYAPLFVTAMVTLDPATTQNGCLEIATGPRRTGLIGEEWKPLAESALELQAVPTASGDVIFFDSYVPHASQPNFSSSARRILYLTYNAASLGDHRRQYYADKYAAFPPDIDRSAGQQYVFRV
jgi:hypothetical protein